MFFVFTVLVVDEYVVGSVIDVLEFRGVNVVTPNDVSGIYAIKHYQEHAMILSYFM